MFAPLAARPSKTPAPASSAAPRRRVGGLDQAGRRPPAAPERAPAAWRWGEMPILASSSQTRPDGPAQAQSDTRDAGSGAPPAQTPAPPASPPTTAPAAPPPCVITTRALKPAPDGSPASRTTVAVGEQVSVSASAAVTWAASAGTLATTRAGTVWTAPDTPGDAVLTATPTAAASGKGAAAAPCQVTLKAIAPSHRVLGPIAPRAYDAALSGSGFEAQVTIAPTSVCFSAIAVREEKTIGNASGYYKDVLGWDHLEHPEGQWWVVHDDNGGISDGIGTRLPGGPGVFAKGSFVWSIQESWRMAGSGGAPIAFGPRAVHTQVMKDATGAETTEKEHTPHSRTPTPPAAAPSPPVSGPPVSGPKGPAPQTQSPPVNGPPAATPPPAHAPATAPHSQTHDAGVPPPPQTPPVQAPPVQAPPAACAIVTQTIAKAPDKTVDTRTTVGVNEHVELDAKVAATWKASAGSFTDKKPSGPVVTWIAPAKGGAATVTATPTGPGAAPCSVAFTVVAPTGRVQTPKTDKAYDPDLAGSGFIADVQIQPANVSFSRLNVREETVRSVASGYYKRIGWHRIPHKPAAGWTKLNADNAIQDDVGTDPPGTHPPFADGKFEWDIPLSYQPLGGPAAAIAFPAPAAQTQTMKDATGEEVTEKEGGKRTRTPPGKAPP